MLWPLALAQMTSWGTMYYSFSLFSAPMQRELGWSPRVPLEDGVKIMLANLNYWREAPVSDAGKIEQATKTWCKYLDTKP